MSKLLNPGGGLYKKCQSDFATGVRKFNCVEKYLSKRFNRCKKINKCDSENQEDSFRYVPLCCLNLLEIYIKMRNAIRAVIILQINTIIETKSKAIFCFYVIQKL